MSFCICDIEKDIQDILLQRWGPWQSLKTWRSKSLQLPIYLRPFIVAPCPSIFNWGPGGPPCKDPGDCTPLGPSSYQRKSQNPETRCFMGVSINKGTPKSSIFIGFSTINHPFWGYPYFWKHPYGWLFGSVWFNHFFFTMEVLSC